MFVVWSGHSVKQSSRSTLEISSRQRQENIYLTQRQESKDKTRRATRVTENDDTLCCGSLSTISFNVRLFCVQNPYFEVILFNFLIPVDTVKYLR